MGGSGAFRRIVLGIWGICLPLAMWSVVQPVPALGQGAGPPAARPGDDARPALPQPANRIGRLRRDESGRIVPAGPPLPAEEPRPPSMFSIYDGREGKELIQPPPVPHISTFDPRILDEVQSRAEHEQRARRMQVEIDTIVRAEAEAKSRGAAVNGNGHTAREEAVIRELERIDRDVREHEMQHYYAGQPFATFPEYFQVTAPNGRPYAISGITRMDASEIAGDRDATILKLETLLRAALAPPEPSEEDKRIAAALEQLIAILRQPTATLP